MILNIAWRNIWRNKVRSLVVMLAMAIGLFAGVFSAALFKGVMDDRIKCGVETEISHIQIHTPTFLSNNEIQDLMNNKDSISNILHSIEGVSSTSFRLVLNGMINSAENGSGIKLVGIDPKEEMKVSNLYLKMIEGTYLNDQFRNPIVISQKTAQKFKVKLKSKVILTFQDINGEIVQAAFRVSGIFKTENTMYDEFNAFVLKDNLHTLSQVPASSFHEIAIIISNPEKIDEVNSSIVSVFKGFDVQSWKQLYPDFGYMAAMMDQMMYIFMLIILIALGFAIVNTMLMVVLERVRELGMLMAIGMSKFRIFSMIMLETIFLSFTGATFGIIAGVLVSLHFQTHGIILDQYNESFNQFGYSAVLHTKPELEMIVVISLLVLLTGIISAIYPARKALKLNPCEALRTQ